MARLHVRNRPRRHQGRVRKLDPQRAGPVRAGHQDPAPVLEDVLPRSTEERRMSTIAVSVARPPLWRRLVGFNLLAGIVLGIVGYIIGHWICGRFTGANIAYYSTEAGQNDIAIFLGYFLGVVGFLV